MMMMMMMVVMMVTVWWAFFFFFFFLKTKQNKTKKPQQQQQQQQHTLLWSRGVTPARCTVRVSARRCLTSNAIFRRKKSLDRFEWLRRRRMASRDSGGREGARGWGCARASQTRQRARGQWQRRARVCISGGGELLRVYFRVRCVFVCRLNGWNGGSGEV